MDNKNVFIAIALSMSVLLFWAMFVEATKPQQNELIKEKVQKQSNEENLNDISPNINQNIETKTMTRSEATNN